MIKSIRSLQLLNCRDGVGVDGVAAVAAAAAAAISVVMYRHHYITST